MSASKLAEKALQYWPCRFAPSCPPRKRSHSLRARLRAGNPRVSPASSAVISPFLFIRARRERGVAFLNAWLAIRRVYAMKDLVKRMGARLVCLSVIGYTYCKSWCGDLGEASLSC